MHRRTAKDKTPYFETTVSTDVEVEIDPDDLREAGWHHESQCRGIGVFPLVLGGGTNALASLHRQAHPSQLPDPACCREEPCRSLNIEQLRGAR